MDQAIEKKVDIKIHNNDIVFKVYHSTGEYIIYNQN